MTVVEMNLTAGSADGSWSWGSLMREAGGSEPRPWHLPHPPLQLLSGGEGCSYHQRWTLKKELHWSHQRKRNQSRGVRI